jgi:hypothetical protein
LRPALPPCIRQRPFFIIVLCGAWEFRSAISVAADEMNHDDVLIGHARGFLCPPNEVVDALIRATVEALLVAVTLPLAGR